MGKEDLLPSENEWKIMEELWKAKEPLTTKEIKERMKGSTMTLKMLRVLTNRLTQKGLIGYEVDANDLRVYHYHALKSREECEKEKSRQFVDSYFSGDKLNALSAMLKCEKLTNEQIDELKQILDKSRKKEKDGKR